jgi:transcriptional regulator with XRE-family HTH domain
MATKAQQAAAYQATLPVLRALREEAGLTQRELGAALKKPQSWVYNCETGNRRVDVTEFIAWARACGADPAAALARVLSELPALPAWAGRGPNSKRSK